MSEVNLHFSLPAEEREAWVAQNGGAMAAAIQEHRDYLRNLLHHGNPFKTPDEAIEAIFKNLHEELADEHLLRIFEDR